MKLIAHKNNQYDYNIFINNVLYKDYIDGLSLDILKTKDNKIIVFTPFTTDKSSIKSLQFNTYDNLKTIDILLLEDILSKLKDTKKIVMLNILPLIFPFDSDQNLIDENRKYVHLINSIINKYKYLNFYVGSINNHIIYHLKNQVNDEKIGYVLFVGNTSFIDTDYYVFTTDRIDKNIIKELNKLKKEIVITVLDCNDLNLLYNDKNKLKQYDNVMYISNYPDLFNEIIN